MAILILFLAQEQILGKFQVLRDGSEEKVPLKSSG